MNWQLPLLSNPVQWFESSVASDLKVQSSQLRLILPGMLLLWSDSHWSQRHLLESCEHVCGVWRGGPLCTIPGKEKNSCPLCLTYFPDIPYFPHTYFHHTTSHIPYSLWLLGFPHLVAAPLDRVPQKEHRSFQVISSDAGNPCMGVKVLPFLSLWFFFPHVQIIRKLHTPMSNWAMTYWSLLSADTPYSPRVLIRSFHELHFMRPVEVKC